MSALRAGTALLALACLSGCQVDFACPEGTVERDGACVDEDSASVADGGRSPDAGPVPRDASPSADADQGEALGILDGAVDADAATGSDGSVCNGLSDAGPCNGCETKAVVYLDADGDGVGAGAGLVGCAAGPYVARGDDCDDRNGQLFPGNTESCNGKDDNCDGKPDEGFRAQYAADCDGDGFLAADAIRADVCAAAGPTRPPDTCPMGQWLALAMAPADQDCDDTSAASAPHLAELCDGVDNDCDGSKDEDLPTTTYFPDCDGDNYPLATGQQAVCDRALLVATVCAASSYKPARGDGAVDCADGDVRAHPGASYSQDSMAIMGERGVRPTHDFNCNGKLDQSPYDNKCPSGSFGACACWLAEPTCGSFVAASPRDAASRCSVIEDTLVRCR